MNCAEGIDLEMLPDLDLCGDADDLTYEWVYLDPSGSPAANSPFPLSSEPFLYASRDSVEDESALIPGAEHVLLFRVRLVSPSAPCLPGCVMLLCQVYSWRLAGRHVSLAFDCSCTI